MSQHESVEMQEKKRKAQQESMNFVRAQQETKEEELDALEDALAELVGALEHPQRRFRGLLDRIKSSTDAEAIQRNIAELRNLCTLMIDIRGRIDLLDPHGMMTNSFDVENRHTLQESDRQINLASDQFLKKLWKDATHGVHRQESKK